MTLEQQEYILTIAKRYLLKRMPRQRLEATETKITQFCDYTLLIYLKETRAQHQMQLFEKMVSVEPGKFVLL